MVLAVEVDANGGRACRPLLDEVAVRLAAQVDAEQRTFTRRCA